MKITINLSEQEAQILKKRAKKNLLTVPEQAEDIIRRSCVNFKTGSTTNETCDDKLVSIFSRARKGRPRKNR